MKYRYKLVYSGDLKNGMVYAAAIEAEANRISAEGWELVSVVPYDEFGISRKKGLVAFFKKPI